jgi:hypothetical protein
MSVVSTKDIVLKLPIDSKRRKEDLCYKAQAIGIGADEMVGQGGHPLTNQTLADKINGLLRDDDRAAHLHDNPRFSQLFKSRTSTKEGRRGARGKGAEGLTSADKDKTVDDVAAKGTTEFTGCV